AKLSRVQRSIRDRDPEHVCVELQVDAIHQPERLELVFGQLAGDATFDLIAELGDPLGYKLTVELVVAVHGYRFLTRPRHGFHSAGSATRALLNAAYSASP